LIFRAVLFPRGDRRKVPIETPRILIMGSAGQLGRELQRSFAGLGDIATVDRDTCDLANPEELRALIRGSRPSILLNAAAYTAVDRAESEPELAHAMNATAPGIMAEEARQLDALLVHYSTDYVFDGSSSAPWTEQDTPRPLNLYGASKLTGERAVAAAGGRYLTFRTSWVYGPHGKNFLFTMLRLGRERDEIAIVDDQVGAPTTSIALADATRTIVDGILAGRFGAPENWAGLYHMTCAGSTSWFGFAQAIFARAANRLGARSPELKPIGSADYPQAPRPRNSTLSNAKLAARFQVSLPTWEAALDAVFDALPR
jgi:dTDP-4-dehydrorhamnose reductase